MGAAVCTATRILCGFVAVSPFERAIRVRSRPSISPLVVNGKIMIGGLVWITGTYDPKRDIAY